MIPSGRRKQVTPSVASAIDRLAAPRDWTLAERRLWRAMRDGECFEDDATVRGRVIRHMLLSPPPPADGQMPQLRARGVRISGVLDLSCADITVPVRLQDCVLDTTPTLEHARLSRIQLVGCALPGLSAEGLAIDGDMGLISCHLAGELNLASAKIGGVLNLRFTQITPAGRIAIDAENADIGGIEARGLRCEGCWYLNSTTTGGVFLDEAQILGEHAFIQAPQMTIGNGGFYARNGFRCEGPINLAYSTAGGPIAFGNATLANAGDKAFIGIGIRLTGDLQASPGSVFEGSIDLAGAEISGTVNLSGGHLTSPGAECAVRLSRTTVQGGMVMRSARLSGPVDLTMARITGGVDLTDAELHDHGSLIAVGASIAGDLDLRNTTLSGRLDVSSAVLHGDLRLGGAAFGQADGISLRASGMSARRLEFSPARPPGRVEFDHAAVAVLADRQGSWPASSGQVALDQFTYQSLVSDMTVRERLAWLVAGTPHAEPGPYNQLAICLRAAGLEREASQVLREKLRRTARTRGRIWQVWGLQDITVCYGYQPGRAVAGVLGLLLAGTLFFSRATCGPATGLCPIKADEHPVWDSFMYCLDLLIPLISLGHDTAWDPTGWSKAVSLVLIVAGWVLVTTVAAAAARALTRP
ncbi:hypothetical protein ACIBI9_39945 [Nonomuraea sp. NPDC050451]|uniref:hypothetical protein n=1 Tax=Nonomuraea sp. NPDC050451 TaxID=3364364 RepID=UPI00379C2E89